jgi:hypothetical protein
MVYISIGVACTVKHQIDKHKKKIETLFFDWLMTSMTSVIEVLRCEDISTILNFDNIVRDANTPYHRDMSRILIKSLNYCVSIHDFKKWYNDKHIHEFIDKYTRRFNRIIQYIKSDEKIYFIRTGSVDDPSRQKFIETVLAINPKCNFALIVIDNDKANEEEIVKYEHCLHMKLNIEKPATADWTEDYLNWKKIFVDIENNI